MHRGDTVTFLRKFTPRVLSPRVCISPPRSPDGTSIASEKRRLPRSGIPLFQGDCATGSWIKRTRNGGKG